MNSINRSEGVHQISVHAVCTTIAEDSDQQHTGILSLTTRYPPHGILSQRLCRLSEHMHIGASFRYHRNG